MNNPTIISYCNVGYFDFAKNMLLSLDKIIKFHKIHFYCLDNEIYEKLLQLKLSNILVTYELWNNTNISSKFEPYGSNNYNSITHTKINILKDALEKYDFIHFIDCDVVCLKEPTLDHYKKYEQYDIVFQYDCGMRSKNDLDNHMFHIWTCTGNTSLRNTLGTKILLETIAEYQVKYKNKNDQECLYTYFNDLSIKDIRTYSLAKLYVYEIHDYTNGYWLNKNIGNLDQTYFFHANHVIGYDSKKNLLKKANQWFT